MGPTSRAPASLKDGMQVEEPSWTQMVAIAKESEPATRSGTLKTEGQVNKLKYQQEFRRRRGTAESSASSRPLSAELRKFDRVQLNEYQLQRMKMAMLDPGNEDP